MGRLDVFIRTVLIFYMVFNFIVFIVIILLCYYFLNL